MRKKRVKKRDSAYYRSLFIILDALQWKGNHKHLSKYFRGSQFAMNRIDMFNTLASIRIRAKKNTIKCKEIRKTHLPCMVIDSHGKPLIKTDISQDYFIAINDERQVKIPPGKKIDIYSFERLDPEEICELDRQKNWFTKFAGRFRGFFAYLMGLSFIINVLNLIAPLLILVVFRQIEAAKDLDNLKQILLGLGLYVSLLAAVRILRSQVLNYLAVRVGYLIGSQVMRRILYLPSAYTEVASVGGQMARIKDFDSIQNFIPGLGTDALLDGPFIFMLLFALLILAGPLALIPLAAMAVLFLFGAYMRKKIDLAAVESSKLAKKRQDFLMDTLNNLEQMQVQYLSRFWGERFSKISKRSSIAGFRASTISSIVSSFSYFVVTVAGVSTVIFGVAMVQSGQLDAASLMASMLLTWKILAPVRNGFSFFLQIDKVRKSISQVDKLMALPQETISEQAFEIEQTIKGSIEFQQVSLKYTNDAHPALLGVNFSIKPGELLVIMGHGGSGQTTIMKLILGLYFPQAGRVLIDNKNTRQLNPNFLREHISYLPEKLMYFSGTIRSTFEHSAPEATDREIEEVLKEIGIWEDIESLPFGLNTRFEVANQMGLSESMQKKLLLAMILLKKSKLWLLDHPDSSEEEGGSASMQPLIKDQKGKSTIVIATQNTSYLKIADKVLILNSGRVQFFGSPLDMQRKAERKVA